MEVSRVCNTMAELPKVDNTASEHLIGFELELRIRL